MADARDLAADLLLRAERTGAWIRDLLPQARERTADPRDRGLLTEITSGVVRRRSTLDALLVPASRQPLNRLQDAVLVGLRLALYQAVFLDRVPVHAAVDHAVGWVKGKVGVGAAGYANAVLRTVLRVVEGPVVGAEDPRRDVPREDGSAVRLREPAFADPLLDPAGNLAERYACPKWLVERWRARHGPSRAEAMLRAGITRPPLALRTRGDRDALVAEMRRIDPSARAGPTIHSVLMDGGEEAALGAVRDGRAAVQDPTSQRVAPLLEPRPGQRLLDLCAAPGGKALHLADLLRQGEVVACDVDERKVEALSHLQVRDGVAFRAVRIAADGPLPFEAASFDGVLVDAPCSNTGVLRRRVEARWRATPEEVAVLARLQKGLLERALPLVKPGGRLVYATCSTEPEENEEVVQALVAAHPGLEVHVAVDAPPGRDADGGFAAVLTLPTS